MKLNEIHPLLAPPFLNFKVNPYVPGGAKLGMKFENLNWTVSPAPNEATKGMLSEWRKRPLSLTSRSAEVKDVSSSAGPV